MNTPNAYAPPKAQVADVDASGDMQLAGRGWRLLAYILDSVILGAIVYTPLIVTGALGAAMTAAVQSNDPVAFYGALATGGIFSAIGFVAWAVVTTILVAKNGQTIAKKLLGIKVVRADGSRASLGRIFWLRNVVNALLNILPFYFLIDALFIFSDRHQTLHDKIADTIVVTA
jgi:uncharacterized RDD family membrane protein YckC